MNLFRYSILFLFTGFILISCKEGDFNDESKRNENWAYWIDEDSGKASWIPIKNETTVENGIYHLFYANGKIFEKGKLKDRKPIDTLYRYDEKENIIRYKIFVNDTAYNFYLKDGLYEEKYQDGSIFQKGTVKNNQMTEDLIRYFTNGQIELAQEFINNTGIETIFYENGQISSVSNRKNGKLHGQVEIWYKNGQLEELSYRKDGLMDGLMTTYYENGALKYEADWKNGKSHGKNEEWH